MGAEEERSWYGPASVVLSIAIAVFVVTDLIEDYAEGLTTSHAIIEIAVVAMAVTHAVILSLQVRAGRDKAQRLGRDLAAARQDAERWWSEARDALRILGEAIDQQLRRWQLTEAEREVALALLKGLTHKEIANTRDTSERTVRQQALCVYRKSGLSGRSELAAFFLEDLLLPEPPRTARAL